MSPHSLSVESMSLEQIQREMAAAVMQPLTPDEEMRKVAVDGRSCHHRRRHQMGASAAALPPAEITIRGRGATFAGRHQIAVDADAH